MGSEPDNPTTPLGAAPTDLTKAPAPDPASPVPTVPAQRLPASYPGWTHELGDLYFSGTMSMFVLHGNVQDFVHAPATESESEGKYVSLAEFLATRLFGSWDLVLHYDLGRGLRVYAGSDGARLQAMVQMTAAMGDPSTWPHSPDKAFALLDRFLRRIMLTDTPPAGGRGPKRARSVAVILQHAQYIVPDADISALAGPQGARLVRLLDWAQNPYLKRMNIAFCLVADKLSEVNRRLVQNPYVAPIEVPMPEEEERERFIEWSNRNDDDFSTRSDFTTGQLAEVSNGLSLVNLNVVLAQARTGSRRLDADRFRTLKKRTIEQQVHGLLEFFEPSHGLDMVVGHVAAKNRLRDDARLMLDGHLDFAPMGYLICGPVGTGKTFLAECYAGSIGIPCVKLLNFRSKYVGETEGNLEQVLTVLRSLGPVVVIVDEADAALGTREASGDSGTSARVFSMIASQMGDTRYRGRILWMLLTSRPDRLPVDLKRQGRAEIHIPLFYPATPDEFRKMFEVMARKNGVETSADAFAHIQLDDEERSSGQLSGSDIEGVVLGANRRALTSGRTAILAEDLDAALQDFVPSAQGLEREAQELAAVLECTQLSFLPERWRKEVAKPNGRVALQERFGAIRQILEER